MNYNLTSKGGLTGNCVSFPSIETNVVSGSLSGNYFSKQGTRQSSFDGLLTNKILAALPGEDFVRLLPYLEPLTLAFAEEIYHYGAGVHYAYFPETAIISHLHILADGAVTEAAMVGREGMIGLSALFGSPQPEYLTQVLIEGLALRINMETLKQEFERGGSLQRLLLQYTNGRITQISQRAVCNGRHSVEERLCNWLLMVHDRAKTNSLPLTHEEIARHLGSRRAGITGIATTLRDSGIIDYSRGVISIVDRAALEATACECYQAQVRASAAVS